MCEKSSTNAYRLPEHPAKLVLFDAENFETAQSTPDEDFSTNPTGEEILTTLYRCKKIKGIHPPKRFDKYTPTEGNPTGIIEVFYRLSPDQKQRERFFLRDMLGIAYILTVSPS